MLVTDLIVEVRTKTLARVGQIEPLKVNLRAELTLNGVGEWTLTLPSAHRLAAELRTPGAGIIVSHITQGVLFSGPMAAHKTTTTKRYPNGQLVVTGVTDDVILFNTQAFPSPAVADPAAQTAAYDTRTGAAQTVMRAFVNANIGPAAPVGRKISLVTLASDGALGGAVTVSARFDRLGDVLAALATPRNLWFRLVQVEAALEFQVFECEDLTGEVRLDIVNGTVSGQTAETQAPVVTRAIVAGQGEGIDRQFVQRTTAGSVAAEAEWGPWAQVEQFIDQRQTNVVGELNQAGDDALAVGGVARTALASVPGASPTMTFPGQWRMGSIIAVVVNGAEVAETVTSVDLVVADTVRVGMGLGRADTLTRAERTRTQVDDIASRTSALERTAEAPDIAAAVATVVGCKNRVINGAFAINQRAVATGVSLPSGTYGFDRWRALVDAATNLATNPSGETATTGHTAIPATTGVAAVTNPTVTSYAGAKSLHCQWSTASTAAGGGMYFDVAVVAGSVYSFAWNRVLASITNRLQLQVEWRTASSTIATDTTCPEKVVTGAMAYGSADFKVENLTAPATATIARVKVVSVAGVSYANWSIGSYVELDALMVNTGTTVAPYFDGASASTADNAYAWTGTAHASTSTRTGLTVLTFVASTQGTLVTIAAGHGLQQPIERSNMEAGTYVVSQAGTATGRMYNEGSTPPALAAFPFTFVCDGTSHVILEVQAVGGAKTVGEVQVERGNTPTVFERRVIGLETTLVRRYYVRWVAAGSEDGIGHGHQMTTTTATFMVPLPVPMRVQPTVTLTGCNITNRNNYSTAVTGVTAVRGGRAGQASVILDTTNAAAGAQVTPATLQMQTAGTSFAVFDAEM